MGPTLFPRPRLRARPHVVIGLLASAVCAENAYAQAIETFFPKGLYGYDQQLGVTVQSRARQEYDALGLQIGDFAVSPALTQSLFYNSNVNGNGGAGSWGSQTAGSVSARSGWSRNSASANFGFDNVRFFSFPGEDYTDWNVGLSGGYSIADSQLVAAYSHQSYHQLSTSIGVTQSSTPILNLTDTAGLEYTFNLGRIDLTPSVGVSAYRFGPVTASGIKVNQDFLNNDALGAGVTARYAINPESGMLLVLHGVHISYPDTQPGQPSNDSNTFAVLGGIDYQPKGVWRYRLLVGVAVRTFAESQFGSRTAPDIEGSVIWTPTGLTTVTASVSNTIESPQTAGTTSYTLSQAHLSVDHEYRRNVLLNGHVGLQYAQFSQLGTQTNETAGLGATWLINRNVRVSSGYDVTRQSSGGSSAPVNGVNVLNTNQYTQQLISVTLSFAL